MSDQAINPWVVQPAKAHNPLPVGMYMSEFRGVSDHKLQDGTTRWRWAWKVMGGANGGQEATALTDQNINPNTLAGRLIAGLVGQPLKTGDNVKALVDAAIGKAFLVSVERGPQGGKPGVKAVSVPPLM